MTSLLNRTQNSSSVVSGDQLSVTFSPSDVRYVGVAAKPGWTRGHTIYRLMDVPPKTRQSNQQSANCLTTPLSTLGSLRPVDIDSYFIPKAAQQRTALLMDTPGLMVPRSEISLEMGLRLGTVQLYNAHFTTLNVVLLLSQTSHNSSHSPHLLFCHVSERL
jgi:hypothetical protein